MGKLVLGMNVSLDGYVDDVKGTLVMGPPSAEVFSYWTDKVRGLAATVYGRRMYEVMRYWDEEHPEWTDALHEFAAVWRAVPKWVVSRTLSAVGPNASLVTGDIEGQMRDLKARIDGNISVSGPELAGLMTKFGLIDEYHLVLRPYVLGKGKPFFHDARPPLRLVSSEQLDDETLQLVYEPA